MTDGKSYILYNGKDNVWEEYADDGIWMGLVPGPKWSFPSNEKFTRQNYLQFIFSYGTINEFDAAVEAFKRRDRIQNEYERTNKS